MNTIDERDTRTRTRHNEGVQLPTAADVDRAAAELSAVIDPSPLQLNKRLSEATGAEVWLKREDALPVRSYKIRGAYHLISHLTTAERAAGVVCASAGNHGQGVAYACRELGISAHIFVPTTTPRQKRDRMLALGGDMIELITTGFAYDDAAAMAAQEVARTNATMVPAFDDPRIVTGQGTIMPEIVNQLGDVPDTLVVPIGGGGMLGGCLTWLNPDHADVRVIGAEPAGAASMAHAMMAGAPVSLSRMDNFVDGASVKRVGAVPYAIAAEHRPGLLQVPEGRICTEMLRFYQVDGIITEPAGALAAAALDGIEITPGERIVVIISGGNNDVSRYAEILERSLIYEGRKHYFMVNFPQEPGALRRFVDYCLGPEDDIVHFEYVKRSNRETGPALVGIEIGSREQLPELLRRLRASHIEVDPIDPASPAYRFLV